MRRDKHTLRQTRELLEVREVQRLDARQKAETARLCRNQRAQDVELAQAEQDRLEQAWSVHIANGAMDPNQIEQFSTQMREQDEGLRRAEARFVGAERSLADRQSEHSRKHAHVEAIRTRHDEQARRVSRKNEARRQSVTEDRIAFEWRQK